MNGKESTDDMIQLYIEALSKMEGRELNIKDSILQKKMLLENVNQNSIENIIYLEKLKCQIDFLFSQIDAQTSFVLSAVSSNMNKYNQIFDIKSKEMIEKLNKIINEKIVSSLNKELESIQKIRKAEDFELQQITEIMQKV